MEKRALGLETEYGYYPNLIISDHWTDLIKKFNGDKQFLTNGARLYLDTGNHPEYATPECSNVTDLIIWDKAGERIMETIVKRYNQIFQTKLTLLKNNISFDDVPGQVSSYGCHENYQIDKKIVQDWDRFFHLIAPFLTTRQIYCGSGKINKQGLFEISQRATKISEEMGSHTLSNRPIIHQKKESLSDDHKYYRLHLILGDANMSEYSAFLKIGATALVLRMIENEFLNYVPQFNEPISALHAISSDLNCSQVFLVEDRQLSAINIQEFYLEKAQKFLQLHPATEEEKKVISFWIDALDTLKKDPSQLNQKVDWVIKKNIIDRYLELKNCNYSDKRARMLDMFYYHNIDQNNNLYYKLQAQNQVERLVSELDIEKAKVNPPFDTRARIRGNLVRMLCDSNISWIIYWDYFIFNPFNFPHSYIFPEPLDNYQDILEEIKQILSPSI